MKASPDDGYEWVLERGGEAADAVRKVDWAANPLGPMRSWPDCLKTLVATLLRSRHPMFLFWGPELIQFYNDAYLPSFGVGKHPVAMGQRGRECWPEIWSIIGPQIEGVMERGEATWQEDALVPIFRNGAIEDVYWTYGYSPAFDERGNVVGTLVVCTETTPRIAARTEESLLRTAAEFDRLRLRQFFAQIPAGVCILRGEDLVFDFANQQYELLVGRTGLLGQPLLEAMPELVGQGLDQLLLGVLETGEPYVGHEIRVALNRRGHGATEDYFYTFSYSPLREADERIAGVIVLAFDVTEQVVGRFKAQELRSSLQERERQFEGVVESIPQLAWRARADGYIEWYNGRWFDYTGCGFEEMQGWGWKSVHSPEFVDEVVARWCAALQTGAPFEMEFPLRRYDGALRWHLTRARPVRDEGGGIVSWIGTNTDIHDSRSAEREREILLESEQAARKLAEVANRAKDDFLSTASHELRTPLNSILGWARLLRGGSLDERTTGRALESIERNSRAQIRLIEDILDGSRIITGKLHLEKRKLDFAALVHAAVEVMRPSAEQKQIALSVETETEFAPLVGDPERLQQVVWNLVSNAIKFTPNGGVVSARLQRTINAWELSVTDTGQGIDAEFLPRVFERFQQAEASSSRRHTGLGLGLALVRHLVEAHAGTVTAQSSGRGLGSVFTVALPLKFEVADAEPPESATVRPPSVLPLRGALQGVIALVVDDERDARELLATVLRSAGADVTIATDAPMALALLGERSFNVLVSDIGMPGSDGYELIRQVRSLHAERRGELRAVALTAYARAVDRRRAMETGFDSYIAKPVDPDEFVRVVARLHRKAAAGIKGDD